MIGAPPSQFLEQQQQQSPSSHATDIHNKKEAPTSTEAAFKGSFYEQAQQRLHVRLKRERDELERRLDQLDQVDLNSEEHRQRLREYIANPESLTAVAEDDLFSPSGFSSVSTDATAHTAVPPVIRQDSLESLLNVVLEREPSGGAIGIDTDVTMGKHKSLSNRSLDIMLGHLSGSMREDSWISRGSVDRQGSVDSSQLADFLGNTFELQSEEFGSWSARVRTRLWTKYWRNERKNIQCFPRCEEYGDYRESRMGSNEHSRNPPSCKGPVLVQLTVPSLGIRYGDIVVIGMVRDVEDEKNSRTAYTEEDLAIEEKKFGAVRGIISEGGAGAGDVSARRGTLGSESEWVILPRGLQKWSYNGELSKVRVAKKDKGTKKTTAKRQTLAVVVEVLCRTSMAASVLDTDVVGSDYVVATRTMSNMFELSTTRTLMRELEAGKGDSASESSSGKSSKSKSSSSSRGREAGAGSSSKNGDSASRKKKRSDREKSIAPSIEPRSRKMTRFEEVKQAGRKLFFSRNVELPDERDLNAIEEGYPQEEDEDDEEEEEDEENKGATVDSKDQEVMRRAQDLQMYGNDENPSVTVNSKQEEESSSYPSTSTSMHVQPSSAAAKASRSAPTGVHVDVAPTSAADFMVRFLEENDLNSLAAPLFAQGYDSLRRLTHVTESDLMELDVLPGHRRHLLALIRDGAHERFGDNKAAGGGVGGDGSSGLTLAAKRAHEANDRMLFNMLKVSTVRRGVLWVSGIASVFAFALVVIVLVYMDSYAKAFGMHVALFTFLAVLYFLSTASLFYSSRYILYKADPDGETHNYMMSLMNVSEVVCCVVSVSLTAALATMWAPVKDVISKPLWMFCMFLSSGVGTAFLVAAVCLFLLGRRKQRVVVQVKMEEAHEAVPVV